MIVFRIFLVVAGLALAVYTALAVSHEGFNLFATTLPAIPELRWPGQFHFDFVLMQVLVGLWVAWRHHFGGLGVVLGLIATFGGFIFMSVYLFVLSSQTQGDVKAMLIGDRA